MTTNYKKIKAMNIDEMAEFLDKATSEPCLTVCGYHPDNCVKECSRYIKQWLESVEE